jgi:thiosulfate reductase/polysulfide reductase chain A
MGRNNTVTATVETICQVCHERCFLECKVKDGQLAKVLHPGCEKGLYMAETLHHPNRLKYPLKAAGEKGTGKWVRISWDEALDLMAAKFAGIRDRFGPEANCVGITSHHKERTCDACHSLAKFLNTPNILDANYQCSQCSCISDFMTFGEWTTWETRIDYENSKCIVIWGANVVDTRPVKARRIFEAQKKGAKVIVIDPRFTETAKRADMWLRVRPQSDGALALAWLNVMIQEGLYDRDFVAQQCLGFEELKQRVAEWTPERAQEITWVPKEQIIEAARIYGRTRPSCIHTRLGVDGQSLNSTQTCRAITCIFSIKGDLDSVGGNILHTPGDIPTAAALGPREYLNSTLNGFRNIYWMMRNWRRSPDLEAKRPGYRDYPIYNGPQEISWFDYNSHYPTLLEHMEAGKVRGLYIPGNNAMAHYANPKRLWNILKGLDFMVVADLFMTPTCEAADLVLPAAHAAEIDSLNHTLSGAPGAPYGNSIVACPKVVDPPGEAWDDMRIVIELGKRMGADVPWEALKDFHDWMLEPVGTTYQELMAQPRHQMIFPMDFKKYELPGWKWNTPTGKVELYSYWFKKLNYDPLPNYREDPVSPLSRPDVWKEYPLIMVHHRLRFYQNSERFDCPSLRKLASEPEIEVHPQTAQGLGIKEGDWMWLESCQMKGERVKGRARLVPEMHPHVVSISQGWWYPEITSPDHGIYEYNVNTIISDGPPFEEFNGHHQMRGIMCKGGKV